MIFVLLQLCSQFKLPIQVVPVNWLRKTDSTPIGLAVGIAILAWPSLAKADVGLPMLALVWPFSWIAFIPIVAVEAVVARRLLKLPMRSCFHLSLSANLWSTLVGIPATWLVLLVVEFGVASLVYPPMHSPSTLVQVLTAPFLAAWVGDVRWQVYAAAAFLCIPFMFASIYVEAWSARRHVPAPDAWRWAKIANVLTYVPIFVVTTAFAIREYLMAPRP